MIMYHGTYHDIESFKTQSKNTFGRRARVAPVPIFLSPSREFAAMQVPGLNGTVLVVKVNPGKVFEGSDLVREDREFWPPERSDLTAIGKRFHDDLVSGHIGPKVSENDAPEFIRSMWNEDYSTLEDVDVREWIQKQGYDSFYVTGDGERNLAVFDPKRLEIVGREKP